MGFKKMKWHEDLIFDIKVHNEMDDLDAPFSLVGSPAEITDCNRYALLERFVRVRDNATAILEIGISRNGADSFTQVFLKNKRPETIYVGIDIDDKSYLNDKTNNIHTIKDSSSNVLSNINFCQSVGVKTFDFIFIDGWHSINQVLIDWEYTRWLSSNGIVGFHDTTGHPGPSRFVRALNRNKWIVEENCCPNDYGIGFATKRS